MDKFIAKTLAEQLGIDEEDIAVRKALIGLTEEDAEELASYADAAMEFAHDVVEEFYAREIENAEFRRAIGDVETLQRLIASMKTYVVSLFSGDYGYSYAASRLRIGRTHARLSIKPKLYISSLHQLKTVIGKHMVAAGLAPSLPPALDRLFVFDMQLVVDTYIQGLMNEIEDARYPVRPLRIPGPAPAPVPAPAQQKVKPQRNLVEEYEKLDRRALDRALAQLRDADFDQSSPN